MSPTRSCRDRLASLQRVAYGEADPRESIDVAEHLTECTACRILLARERRLAQALAVGLDDPLEVGEEFLSRVMDNLPMGPPPVRPGRRRDRRRLKLA